MRRGSKPPGRLQSVLLVDDDAELLAAMRRSLRRRGYHVVSSSSGSEALEHLAEGAFDVLLSDVQMPGIGGVSLLRELRARNIDVPVVLMTGNPEFEAVASAIEHRAFRFLIKPFPEAELVEVLTQAITAGPDAALNRALASLGATLAPIVRTTDGTVFAQGVRVQTGERTLPDLAAVLEAAERRKRLQATGQAARDFVASIIGLSEPEHSFFVRIDLRELLDPMLCASGVPLSQCAERVVLELVNTGSVQSLTHVRDSVVQLRDLGFRIALDDLGAGYAALTSLATLEPEFIKLNRSLVDHIHENRANQHIVGSLVRLGHEMGSLTVADGVTKQEERDVLATLGCDLMQGGYFENRARHQERRVRDGA